MDYNDVTGEAPVSSTEFKLNSQVWIPRVKRRCFPMRSGSVKLHKTWNAIGARSDKKKRREIDEEVDEILNPKVDAKGKKKK